MALNYLFIAFFLISFIVAALKLILTGDTEIFSALVNSTFDMAKTGFELSLGLTGVMTLWLGIMKIGENAGMIRILSRMINPLFKRLFPEIPAGHPASGSILMNIAANMLGLDNAATPLGLKAMQELQEINSQKDTASNSQILFLVLNTSGLTLIPISIMVYRVQMGASNPADIFIPILIATFISTLAGIIAVSVYQKINLFNKIIFTYLGGMALLISLAIYFLSNMPEDKINLVSSVVSNGILFTIICVFIMLGLLKKINVYESFIEGAKDGFQTAIKIIPYLVAILVAIGVFRISGAMDYLIQIIAIGFEAIGVNTDFVAAMPTALMKPLSGSGARGMMIESMKTYGVDSFIGRLSCVFQGSTDTTFYVLAVYFGSIGIKKTRYALVCGLIADFFGIMAAIAVSYFFFH